MLLPLSLFLGVLLAYGRVYADNEMTVLHGCGVSEWYIVRITLVLSLITALLTATFSLYLAPMATEYEYKLKEELAADAGLSALVEGRFQQTGNEDAVVFIHDKSRKDNSLQKIFVAQLPDKNLNQKSVIHSSLVYAQKGFVIEDDSGSQRLVLEQGTRYQSDAKTDEFRVVEFSKYYIQIEDQEVEHRRRKLSAVPTQDLFSNPTAEYKAAIQWRLAFPISCILLTLIAVPLSSVNPRQGKFGKMVPALMLFLGYFLLLISMRSALESGTLPSKLGLWPIHISALAIGGSLLLNRRSSGLKIRDKLHSLAKIRVKKIKSNNTARQDK